MATATGDHYGMTDSQYQAVVLAERVGSCLSIGGIIFIITTYLFARGFDKPINRLIFYASFGNLGSNIGALISENGPNAGAASAICQFEAFLVQMFLGVDCYWALCMAVNVYLIFFRNYTVDRLRSLDIAYLLACYGLSFIPAFVFLFISTDSRGRMYGPATIWCWISSEWDFMRFIFLYGIVWAAICLAFVVYGMAIRVIWRKRDQLQGFLNPLNENPFTNMIVTEIEITSDECPIMEDTHANLSIPGVGHFWGTARVDINATPPERQLPAALRMRSITRQIAAREANAQAFLYARVAFLFFFALLVTWVPTSVNRLYSLIQPTVVNFPLNYIASLVFPLQAFWNAIIYIITSQTAMRALFARIFGSDRKPQRLHNSYDNHHGPYSRELNKASKNGSIESHRYLVSSAPCKS